MVLAGTAPSSKSAPEAPMIRVFAWFNSMLAVAVRDPELLPHQIQVLYR
ncbi:hypothetical protein Mth01_42790 [Sphaerimonospora thailandensis]|uniref:Uncharacterized protein n=1 Tax=Sphaerimonospora thailandensis TaxID=795644 RepID=A0A8J3R9S9_9ACTN|nr:hypothetical protein Mth01_42790 [Sphaerimonospora thailandensis]